jgi:hypothetical protein
LGDGPIAVATPNDAAMFDIDVAGNAIALQAIHSRSQCSCERCSLTRIIELLFGWRHKTLPTATLRYILGESKLSLGFLHEKMTILSKMRQFLLSF